ncbi:hypothetical protein [Dyadobacter pollutisoli]|uniref:Uncharacterized protein n=1 Tax=Dyadobacter pollutisoli TaxID=2910158 RepID=A0A9E8ND81_9BACT|nr:hypothetical protein [Dyadobacter pollutisoli]WAC12846.1 hypothetical protein ON006_02545 [Dyadobacter pollutisoli]
MAKTTSSPGNEAYPYNPGLQPWGQAGALGPGRRPRARHEPWGQAGDLGPGRRPWGQAGDPGARQETLRRDRRCWGQTGDPWSWPEMQIHAA